MPIGGLGGAPDCPKCQGRVYFSDQKGYRGRDWHRSCFRCCECNKGLESGTANITDDDQLFCNNCFRRVYASQIAATNQPRQEYVNHEDAECCPRCGKKVFFAEQLLSLGRKWHKTCFTCASCKKKLDSTSAADHDGELFCRACHSRSFGPKGYGFAGGASGLSMDNGRANEICRENVPQTSEAYNAVGRDVQDGYMNGNHNGNGNGLRASNGTSKPKPRWGGGDYCPRCEKQVFIAEKRCAAGNTYHDKCFTCYCCNKKLDSSKLTENDNEVFCKVCYGKKFGPKGYGFGGGAGTLQMTL